MCRENGKHGFEWECQRATSGSTPTINNIVGALERELFTRKWEEKSSTEWLPFQNGVLELATGKLHNHSPGFRFTWQLPRDYTVVETGWTKINTWLDEATKGNSEYKELLLCFAAAVLRGRNDLQKFLHLIGGGGSGKSTFTNLLTALIGEENTVTLNLTDLEDKHEIARIFGKRLVVLPDQDKAPKKMSNFKRLTGQDRLSGRRLFENGFEYVFQGLTVVTSNFPIFHTNVGSWLTRRVKMIPFDYQCPNHKKRDLMGEFEPELGAFTSYLLSIPSERIEAVLKGLGDRSVNPTVWESQIRSDGLAAWVNDWVVQDSTARVRIGSNAREWASEEEYDAARSTLYGSYALYCQQSNRSAKSPQNFSAELLELTNRILGWEAEKGRVKMCGKTVRVIKGLRLRSELDNEPTIEEILEVNNQVDNKGDRGGPNPGDNLKSPLEKESDKVDDLEVTNKENEIKLDSSYENPPTVTEELEIKTEITVEEVKPSSVELEAEVKAARLVVPSEIDWVSYPYNSSDRYTLENRANKVKARILACATSNELISLHADGKVSAPEIKWLKENLLSEAELTQLITIETTKQGNLFSLETETESLYYEWSQIRDEIDFNMKRLGWSKRQGREYLIKRYGKRSRLHLTDEELIEFWNYLKKK